MLHGFARNPMAPESMHSFSNLSWTCAVQKTTLGTGRLLILRDRELMIRQAFTPSRTGICISYREREKKSSDERSVSVVHYHPLVKLTIQIRSYEPRASASTAACPSCTISMCSNPRRMSIRLSTFWLTELSSAIKKRKSFRISILVILDGMCVSGHFFLISLCRIIGYALSQSAKQNNR